MQQKGSQEEIQQQRKWQRGSCEQRYSSIPRSVTGAFIHHGLRLGWNQEAQVRIGVHSPVRKPLCVSRIGGLTGLEGLEAPVNWERDARRELDRMAGVVPEQHHDAPILLVLGRCWPVFSGRPVDGDGYTRGRMAVAICLPVRTVLLVSRMGSPLAASASS